MEISFTPSADVALILNTLLDKLEQRAKRSPEDAPPALPKAPRPLKVALSDLPLPAYFSQTDPTPRLLTNEQLQVLERAGLLRLAWLPGERGHLLSAATLSPEHAPRLYELLGRVPLGDVRARLESLLLAERFRFLPDDWRAAALRGVLGQLRAGKSPSPFSLSDSGLNLDLLTLLAALPDLQSETPYRVFSVRVFNNSKRFDELKPALLRLARRANPQWKALLAEELLRELNLVANPGYLHLAGGWQLTTAGGEILSLGGFSPSVGFSAVQTPEVRAVEVYAGRVGPGAAAVLCIENLTTFHEFTRLQAGRYAVLCTMGNPSPSVRRVLRLIPEAIPLYLWADLDYGGFNILSQLRRQVSRRIQPYRMGIADFEAYAHLSRPLTRGDERHLKSLLQRSELADVGAVIEHLIRRGLKLEQEALDCAQE